MAARSLYTLLPRIQVAITHRELTTETIIESAFVHEVAMLRKRARSAGAVRYIADVYSIETQRDYGTDGRLERETPYIRKSWPVIPAKEYERAQRRFGHVKGVGTPFIVDHCFGGGEAVFGAMLRNERALEETLQQLRSEVGADPEEPPIAALVSDTVPQVDQSVLEMGREPLDPTIPLTGTAGTVVEHAEAPVAGAGQLTKRRLLEMGTMLGLDGMSSWRVARIRAAVVLHLEDQFEERDQRMPFNLDTGPGVEGAFALLQGGEARLSA